MNQEWSVMNSLLQHPPTSILHVDSPTSTPHCNALSRKPLYAPPQRSTQFIHTHRMSHADAQVPTNTSSTNHGISKTSTATFAISILQNYAATLSNFSSSRRLCVKTACHHKRIPGLPRTLTYPVQWSKPSITFLNQPRNNYRTAKNLEQFTNEWERERRNPGSIETVQAGRWDVLKKMNEQVRTWVCEMAVGSDGQQLMLLGRSRSSGLNGIYSHSFYEVLVLTHSELPLFWMNDL
jgi:hypothetical protein